MDSRYDTLLQRWRATTFLYIDKSLSFLKENSYLGKEYVLSRMESADEGSFNIFKLISDLYYRENFHSDIMAFLLNPQENHHCGDVFLNSFFRLIEKFGKRINDNDYKDAIVLREEGKIDILIKSNTSKKAIVIENKINNAPDMCRQLPRYYDILNSEAYSIDAIVYLPLAKSKKPDLHDWSDKDKSNVLPLIVIIPAYDKSSTNIVTDWLVPTLSIIDYKNVDVISTIKQYSSLIKSLNINIMDTVILEKFYQGLMKEDNLETAKSIRNMLNDIPSYMALRIQDKFGGICSPFSHVWIYKSHDAVFEGLNFRNYYLKMDIWCYEHGYDVLFWAPDEQEEDGFEEIINSIESLKGFNKKQEVACQYIKQFEFKDEIGLYSFIESLIRELREKKEIINKTQK